MYAKLHSLCDSVHIATDVGTVTFDRDAEVTTHIARIQAVLGDACFDRNGRIQPSNYMVGELRNLMQRLSDARESWAGAVLKQCSAMFFEKRDQIHKKYSYDIETVYSQASLGFGGVRRVAVAVDGVGKARVLRNISEPSSETRPASNAKKKPTHSAFR